MQNTARQYDSAISQCKDIFLKKMKDYGTAWRNLRPTSLTDQIFIKAQRIRTLQEKGVSKVGEGIIPEFVGIINYCIMALIQLELGVVDQPDLNLRVRTSYQQTERTFMLTWSNKFGNKKLRDQRRRATGAADEMRRL